MRQWVVILEAAALAALLALGLSAAVSGATREAAPDTKAADEAAKATIEGRWLIAQRRYDEAVDKLQFALSLAPGDPEATRLLAQARAVHDQAQGHVDKAAQLMKANRWDEAVQELNAATNVYPSCKEAKALLASVNGKAAGALLASGQALLAEGKLAEAEAALQKAIDFDSDAPGAREALARVAFQRADAAAARGLWGQALLWAREASQYMPKAPQFQAAVQAARDRVMDRVRFTVGPATNEGRAPTALARSFSSALWTHLGDRKTGFLDPVGPGSPKALAYTVRADVGPLVIQEERTRTENGVFHYTAQKEEPNPDYVRVEDLLRVATANVGQLRIDYDRPCAFCGGSGWAICRTCGGTGIVAGPTGNVLCPICNVPGGRPGRARCWRCGGTGRAGGVSAWDIRRAQDEADRLQYLLARTPPTVLVPSGDDWTYTIEYFEKSGSLDVALKVAVAATGQVVYSESVRRQMAKEDTGIQNANPAIGLAAKAPKLPSDEKMAELLVDAAGDLAAGKVLAAVAGAKAAECLAAADRLFKDGKTAEAIEASMDAAVVKEAVNPQEAARLMTDLRVRLRTAGVPAAVAPPR